MQGSETSVVTFYCLRGFEVAQRYYDVERSVLLARLMQRSQHPPLVSITDEIGGVGPRQQHPAMSPTFLSDRIVQIAVVAGRQ